MLKAPCFVRSIDIQSDLNETIKYNPVLSPILPINHEVNLLIK